MKRFFAIAATLTLLTLRVSSDPSKESVDCKNHLKLIGVYYALYESKFRCYPDNIDQIKRPDMATDEKVFACPVTGEKAAYVYVFPAKGDVTPEDAVMTYEEKAHPDGTRHVLTFWGAVYALAEDDFKAALKDGVMSVMPHVVVKKCELVTVEKHSELVISGTVVGLRPAPGDATKALAGTLKFDLDSPQGEKDPDPIKLSGTVGGPDLTFETRIVFKIVEATGYLSLRLDITDSATNREFRQSPRIEAEKK